MPLLLNGVNMRDVRFGTTPVERIMLGTNQVWQRELVVTLANRTASFFIKDLFSAADWDSDMPKRVVVPAGVELKSDKGWGAVALMGDEVAQASSFGGSLTIDVYGTITGIGGAPNSGMGGHAIRVKTKGKSGQKVRINAKAGATIRGGGGGGGRGGQGGQGKTDNWANEGPVFNQGQYQWEAVNTNGGKFGIFWAGAKIADFFADSQVNPNNWTQYDIGAHRYFKDGYQYDYAGFRLYAIRRQLITPAPVYHAGGAGGAGGRGMGSDGPNTGGSTGSPGSNGSGAGGAGGWGMHFGGDAITGNAGQGRTGEPGAPGNYGAGQPGIVGGLGGAYLNGNDNADLFNEGATLQGRNIAFTA